MITLKSRLLTLLAAEVALITFHVFLREPMSSAVPFNIEWHGWLALFGGVVIIAYAYSIRCPATSCKRQQVFRGLSFFDIRLPEERCYVCHTPLEKV